MKERGNGDQEEKRRNMLTERMGKLRSAVRVVHREAPLGTREPRLLVTKKDATPIRVFLPSDWITQSLGKGLFGTSRPHLLMA